MQCPQLSVRLENITGKHVLRGLLVSSDKEDAPPVGRNLLAAIAKTLETFLGSVIADFDADNIEFALLAHRPESDGDGVWLLDLPRTSPLSTRRLTIQACGATMTTTI